MVCSSPIPPLSDPALRRILADKLILARQVTTRQTGLSTGWADIDRVLPTGGLPRAMVHEWISLTPTSNQPTRSEPARRPSNLIRPRWAPPLSILIHLARRAHAASPGSLVLWIGATLWPYAQALAPRESSADATRPTSSLLSASLFLHAPDTSSRIWAADLALRSRSACAVVVDASNFDLSSTRRLQLAAEGGGGLCLLARPPWEQQQLSAAGTRWLIRPCPTPTDLPTHTSAQRWAVELLRCKGMPPTPSAPREWTLEFNHATSHVAVVPDLRRRPSETQAEPPSRRFA